MTATAPQHTRTAIRISTLLLVLAAAACDGEDPTGSTPPATQPKPVATVQLSPDETVIVESWMRQIELKLLAADGSTLNARPAEWSSSDTTVAVVSSSGPGTGQVVARGAGTAVVTAVVDGKAGTAAIEVEARRVERITLSRQTLTLGFMNSGWAGATATAQDGHYIPAAFTWSSSDTTVVSVDASGKMTALSPGSAVVTARAGEVRAHLQVTAADPVLAGNWTLVLRDVEDGETVCSVDGVSLRAIVAGMQVSGGTESWSNPTVTCPDVAAPIGALKGVIHRTSVSLAIGQWALDGAFQTADRIDGTARYYEDAAGVSVRTGRFVLVRG